MEGEVVYDTGILICSTGLGVSAADISSLATYRFPFDCSYRCIAKFEIKGALKVRVDSVTADGSTDVIQVFPS